MYTQQEIDRAFAILKKDVEKRSTNGTSENDVLQYMFENIGTVWFMSWELIGKVTNTGKFLSHRAPARMSDLAINSPQLVEDREIGRFKAYRLRTENMNLIEARLGKKCESEKATIPVHKYEYDASRGVMVEIIK